MLLLVERLDAVTSRVVVSELGLVLRFVKLGLLVPQFAFEDVNYEIQGVSPVSQNVSSRGGQTIINGLRRQVQGATVTNGTGHPMQIGDMLVIEWVVLKGGRDEIVENMKLIYI